MNPIPNNKRLAIFSLFGISLIIAGLAYVILTPTTEQTQYSLRLLWLPQSQFAGYIIAYEKGYYADEGINLKLNPGGPDLMPQATVASGSDQFGVTVSNQIITARSNGAPLLTIAQIFQDSANRYVLKKENQITTLTDLRGKSVGLWMGGDEAEFSAMLSTAGLSLNDINIVPQGFSIAPFLHDDYVISMVTTYNELQLILDKIPESALQIVAPSQYDSAIVGDGLFTTETFAKTHPDVVDAVVRASLRGWKYAIIHPDEALDIVLSFNKDLQRQDQERQLKAVLSLVTANSAATHGIGYIDIKDFQRTESILSRSKQISRRVDPASVFTLRFWDKTPDEYKKF